MNKKEKLLEQLHEDLKKGEIDPSVITKVELGDERFIDIFFDKVEKLRKEEE